MAVNLLDVGSGFKRTAINSNFTTIESELNNNVLTKDGGTQLEADLDFNSNKAINIANGINNTDAVNVQQLNGAISAASSGLIASQIERLSGSDAVSRVFTFGGISYIQGANNLEVYRNGQRLDLAEDYTETSTSSVTLTFDPNPADKFVFRTNTSTTNNTTVTTAIQHSEDNTQYILETYLQNRHIISILDFGVDNTGATDSTTEWDNAISAASGKILFVPKGTYLKGRNIIGSNVTILCEPGCVFNIVTGGSSLFRWNGSDSHLFANGATFNSSATATSHTLYLDGATRCTINDANVVGSGGTGDDGIYFGGATPCYSCVVRGGSVTNALRNGISVVDAYDCVIDGVEVSGTTGSPGAGIDIEANFYGKVRNITIQNCVVHDNIKNGIVNVFGEELYIRNNRVYDNGTNGIAVAAAGNQFDLDKIRTQDVRGVSAFDTVTGTITANAVSQDSDLGVSVGDIIVFVQADPAGTLPADLSFGTRYVVTEKSSGGNNGIKIGTAYEYGEFTSFADAGAGTLTLDPQTSDILMYCYSPGQSSEIYIEDNIIYGNTNSEINISTSVNVTVRDNICRHDDVTEPAIKCQYTRDVYLENNTVEMDIAGANQSTGISISTCSEVKTKGNKVREATGEGITISGCSRARLIDDELYNCGRTSTRAMRLQLGDGAKVSPIIRQDTKSTVTYGIRLESTTTNCLVTGADCYTAGTSNANSISDVGTGNRLVDSRLNDGTFTP